jgi:hypothetical protein
MGRHAQSRLVIPSAARNHYREDCAWNPSIMLPIVIPRCARNDKGESAPLPQHSLLILDAFALVLRTWCAACTKIGMI